MKGIRYWSAIFILLILSFVHLAGQSSDSLISQITGAQIDDSTMVIQLLQLAHRSNNEQSIKADSIAEIARDLAQKSQESHLLAAVQNAFAQLFLVRGEYRLADSTLALSKKTLNFISPLHNENIRRLNIEGLVRYYQGDYVDALPLFFERLSLGEQLNNKQIQIRTLNNIGICYERLQDYVKTNEYYLKGMSILEGSNYTDLSLANQGQYQYMKASLQSNIGATYIQQDEYDQAIGFLVSAYQMATELGNSRLTCDASVNLGRAYTGLKQYGLANPYFKEAIELAKNLNDPTRNITSSIALAGNLRAGNRLMEAEQLLIGAQTIMSDKGIQEQIVPLHEEFISLYNAMGNAQQSSLFAQALGSIKDSIFAKEKVTITEELNTKYNSAINEARVAESELLLANERFYRNLLLIGLALLLIGISFAALLRKNRRQLADQLITIQEDKIKSLEQKQKLLALDYIVQGQEEERKRIAQDLHDGLGGLLTSLRHQIFSIQEKIEALTKVDIAKDAELMISKACEEVRRISHDMMPASLVSLGLKDTLEDLVFDLNRTNNFKTKLQIKGDLDQLSKNLEVNIFRIIQEAANNTIKHARATRLQIDIQVQPDQIAIRIQDDGVGIANLKDGFVSGIGLKNIQSRVEYLGGNMKLEVDNGTSIIMTVPTEMDLQG